ncbi:MAG: hypothetical protein V4565_08325 [Bacteroidota bacterium]
MKKILLMVTIVSLTMVSCKKDRICECKTSTIVENSNTTNTSSEVNQTVMINTTKRTAKLACIHSKSVNVNTNTTVINDSDCQLK